MARRTGHALHLLPLLHHSAQQGISGAGATCTRAAEPVVLNILSAGQIFRIGTMGYGSSAENIARLLAALEEGLREQGYTG